MGALKTEDWTPVPAGKWRKVRERYGGFVKDGKWEEALRRAEERFPEMHENWGMYHLWLDDVRLEKEMMGQEYRDAIAAAEIYEGLK